MCLRVCTSKAGVMNCFCLALVLCVLTSLVLFYASPLGNSNALHKQEQINVEPSWETRGTTAPAHTSKPPPTEQSKSKAEERGQRLQEMCQRLKVPSKSHVSGQYMVNKRHRLVYCPIQKVGSSFWKRVFAVLKNSSILHGQKKSLFDMSGVGIHRAKGLGIVSAVQLINNRSTFLSSAYKFMFVRDPYERLFSGYIDKLFTPTYETTILSLAVARTLRRGVWSVPRYSERRGIASFDKQVLVAPELFENKQGLKVYPNRRLLKYYDDEDTKDVNNHQHEDIVVGLPDVNSQNGARNDEGFGGGDSGVEGERGLLDPSLVRRMQMQERKFVQRNAIHKRLRSMRQCPLKMTFTDFVRYIASDTPVDVHFRPMSHHCPPCFLRYNFIGQMETFKDDVSSILTAAGVDPAEVVGSDDTFDHNSDMNIMHDVAARTFSVMRKYARCMTPGEMLRRTWTTFQIRGFLSTKQPYPLTEYESRTITFERYMVLVNHSYSQSIPREECMRQRKAAMLEAFASLPRSLLISLEAYVRLDCKIFGYECSVDKRFPLDSEAKPVFHFQQTAEDNYD